MTHEALLEHRKLVGKAVRVKEGWFLAPVMMMNMKKGKVMEEVVDEENLGRKQPWPAISVEVSLYPLLLFWESRVCMPSMV